MTPTFACGMPNPWTPWVVRPPDSPVIVTERRCDHCFCKEARAHAGEGPHLQCCKCLTLMAEKFVKAWFEILAEPRP